MTHSTSQSCPSMHARERHSSYSSACTALDPSVSIISIDFPACTASLTGAPSTPSRDGHQTDEREFFDTELYGNARADRFHADLVRLVVRDAASSPSARGLRVPVRHRVRRRVHPGRE